MKVESLDPMLNVLLYAWFTSEIPVSGRQESLGGLHSKNLKLVFNGDDVVIISTDVSSNDSDLKYPYPKKYRGKQIIPEEYLDLRQKAKYRSLEGKRNPFKDI